MKPIIAITMGDPAGIGAEVTVRALTHRDLYETCIPLVIGSAEALADANRFTNAGLTLRAVTAPGERAAYPVRSIIWTPRRSRPAPTCRAR